jgi:hypothetical protein
MWGIRDGEVERGLAEWRKESGPDLRERSGLASGSSGDGGEWVVVGQLLWGSAR